MKFLLLLLILLPIETLAIPMPDEKLDLRWTQNKDVDIHPILKRDLICFFKLNRGVDLPIKQLSTLLTEITSKHLSVVFSEGFMDTPDLRAEGESPYEFKIRDSKNHVMTLFFRMVPGLPRIQRVRLLTDFDLQMKAAVKSFKRLEE